MSSKVMVQSDDPKLRSEKRAYGKYLVVRGCLLYFRYVVPIGLRSALGYTEIRRTMGGASIRCARAVAAIMGSRLKLLFDDAMRDARRGYGVEKDKLAKLVHLILDEELDRLSREVAHRAAGLDAQDVLKLQKHYKDIAIKFSVNPWDSSIQSLGQELINNAINGANSDSAQQIRDMVHGLDDVGVIELRQAIIKTRETAYDAVAFSHNLVQPVRSGVHDNLDYFFPRSSQVETSPAQAVPDISTVVEQTAQTLAKSLGLSAMKTITVGEAVTIFLESQRTDKPRSLRNKELALKEFTLAMGADRLTVDIDVAMIERYAKLLPCLPNRRGGQTLRDDIWSYVDNQEGRKCIDSGSVKSKLSHVKTLLYDMKRRNFISEGLLSASCFVINSVTNPIDLEKSREVKPPFELGHLEILFNPDKFLPWTSLHGDDFWIPLIGLFTGARIEEITRLQRKDIKQTPEMPVWSKKKDKSRHGIWYMDITSSEKGLKNNGASHRVMPLHPYLVDIGFIDYISDFNPGEFIFPHYGMREYDKASDMFVRYRRLVGVGRQKGEDTGDELTFHTFRHTLADTFKDNFVPDSVSREIMGHSPGKDVHANTYEKNHNIETLFDKGIMVLDYYVDNVDALRKIAALAKTVKAPWTMVKKERPVYRIKGKRRSFEYPYKIVGE